MLPRFSSIKPFRGGRLIACGSCAPAGLQRGEKRASPPTVPWLTPWAVVYRPCGATTRKKDGMAAHCPTAHAMGYCLPPLRGYNGGKRGHRRPPSHGSRHGLLSTAPAGLQRGKKRAWPHTVPRLTPWAIVYRPCRGYRAMIAVGRRRDAARARGRSGDPHVLSAG